MTSYQFWDTIADAYTPLLFLAYIVFSIIYFRDGDRSAWLKGLAGIVLAYAIMFLDKITQLWASLSLDYSTHSAVALVLIMFLVHKRPMKSLSWIALVLSLVAYYCLEVYMAYHSVADIVSTVIVLMPLVVVIYWSIGRVF